MTVCERTNEEIIIKHKWLRADEAINTFKEDLQAHNWDLLYKE